MSGSRIESGSLDLFSGRADGFDMSSEWTISVLNQRCFSSSMLFSLLGSVVKELHPYLTTDSMG